MTDAEMVALWPTSPRLERCSVCREPQTCTWSTPPTRLACRGCRWALGLEEEAE